jgi:GT2 family glycosyltransferase
MQNHVKIDVIIVSYAQNEELKEVTVNAINSLITSEDPDLIKFNIIIIESQRSLAPYQYPHTHTIYPNVPFGYHKYLNIGIDMTSSPFICICNNDLIFYPSWATELLRPLIQFADVFSASPICPQHHPSMGFRLNDGIKLGYRTRYEISGWCILMKREIFARTGRLDENFAFWYADDDYALTLFALQMTHVLVTSSYVYHIESKTLKQQSKERENELTEKESTYYQKKWNHRTGNRWTEL